MGTANPIQHRHLIASAFHAISFALGIPSTIAFVFLTWEAIQLHMMRVPDSGGTTGNQLIDLLFSGFRLFGKLFVALGDAAKWVMTLLAFGSFLAIVVSVIFYYTARGLHAGRTWARMVGILLAILPLLISLLAVASAHRSTATLFFAMIGAACVYVIWTLGWRFA